jgi:hypothetical protein
MQEAIFEQLLIFNWNIVGAIASSISAFTSLIAIPFVVVQLRASNRIAKAQLINELERDIALHSTAYALLTPGSKLSNSQVLLADEEKIALLKYISFFERISAIVETGVLDLPTVDRLFAGRFFYLFNNAHVIKILDDEAISPYMKAVRSFYGQWYAYRKSRDLDIPLEPKEVLSHGLQ